MSEVSPDVQLQASIAAIVSKVLGFDATENAAFVWLAMAMVAQPTTMQSADYLEIAGEIDFLVTATVMYDYDNPALAVDDSTLRAELGLSSVMVAYLTDVAVTAGIIDANVQVVEAVDISTLQPYAVQNDGLFVRILQKIPPSLAKGFLSTAKLLVEFLPQFWPVLVKQANMSADKVSAALLNSDSGQLAVWYVDSIGAIMQNKDEVAHQVALNALMQLNSGILGVSRNPLGVDLASVPGVMSRATEVMTTLQAYLRKQTPDKPDKALEETAVALLAQASQGPQVVPNPTGPATVHSQVMPEARAQYDVAKAQLDAQFAVPLPAFDDASEIPGMVNAVISASTNGVQAYPAADVEWLVGLNELPASLEAAYNAMKKELTA